MKGKTMISSKEFAEQVGRSYQTVMYWLRNGLVPGVEVIQETRGPVYLVPQSVVEQFKLEGVRRGRPPKPKKERASKKKASKK